MTVVRLRRTWEATWMGCADVIARRSACERDQVGAVITDAANRVVSSGYNGPPAGMETTCELCPRNMIGPPQLCVSIHAEANAIAFCDRAVREGGTIYVTSTPCYACALLMANSGVARVVARWDLSAHAHRNPVQAARALEMSGIELVRWEP